MKVKFKNIICLTIISFWSLIITAQSEKWVMVSKSDMAKVFEEMNNWFKNTSSYSLTITHASFQDYKTSVPSEKSVGYFKKDKDNYHSFLLGIHTIQNTFYKIVIDTSEKILMVANPDQLVWNSYTLEDYTFILKNCSTIKVAENGMGKRYRIEFEGSSSIGSYEFVFNTAGLLKEVVSYFNQEIEKNEDDKNSPKVKPRISIAFSEYKIAPFLVYKEEFDESNYFTQKNNILIPIARYINFRLNDQRLYKTK